MGAYQRPAICALIWLESSLRYPLSICSTLIGLLKQQRRRILKFFSKWFFWTKFSKLATEIHEAILVKIVFKSLATKKHRFERRKIQTLKFQIKTFHIDINRPADWSDLSAIQSGGSENAVCNAHTECTDGDSLTAFGANLRLSNEQRRLKTSDCNK